MLIALEGIVMCFVLLIICVVATANGPVGAVTFYEKDVQKRVVELGITTEKEIKKRSLIITLALYIPLLTLVPYMVYGINGASGFWNGFWQMSAIMIITGLFDRLFIDWYWVEHTKAWHIEGTEDLKPYIPAKIKAGKWFFTLVGFPVISAIIAGIAELIM